MITLSPGRPLPRSGVRARLMRRTALGGVLMIVANAGAAAASPVLSSIPAQVVHAPVIAAPNANLTTVTLKQSHTLINWSSFDIAQGQQVDFLFQNNAGIVLNRVNSLAVIDGKLLGCVITCGAGGSIGGNVWIFSPQGVLFGPHAQVNVGGLLATTAPLLSDQAFLDSSQLSFSFGGAAAGAGVTVQSGAQLNARGALALIAPSVTTEAGSTIAAGGTALYAAAQNYVIHFDQSAGHGLNLLDFEVPASALTDGTVSATPLTLAGDTAAGKVIVASVSRPSVMNAMISLGGSIVASGAADGGGGDIVLTASGGPASVNIAGALQASHGVSLQAPDGGSITISGSVSAASASGAGGAIQVGGAGTGAADLTAGGRLDASSATAGQSGGSVVLTAGAVRVDGAIAATGPAGGGTILIGGGAQGKDASVADALTTTVGAGALIDASAGANGDGGHVVVWSNQNTAFQGAILGRGGVSGGAGGSAEVSSAGYLSYAGAVDLRAANGTAGQLLLDPSELVVVPTGGSGAVSAGANTPATSATSTIGADTIDAALLTSDVTISTHMSLSGGDGVIEFNGGAGPLVFANTGSAIRTLSFVPEQGFVFDTGLATKGPVNLTLNAGSSPVALPVGGVAVTDGVLTVIGSNLSLLGDLAAPDIGLTASGAISQTGGIITTGGLTGSSGGATSLPDANAVGNLASFTAGAGLTFTNAGAFSANGVSAGSGALALTSTSGALTVDGVSAGTNVSLTAGGNLNLVGDVTGATATFSAGGAIDQAGGAISATTLSATAVNGISLTDGNAVANLGATANTGSGGVALDVTGALALTGGLSAPGQEVSLVAAGGAITQPAGGITANALVASGAGGLSLTGANQVGFVYGLASGAGGLSFIDGASFTLEGDIAGLGQSVSLTSTGGSISQAVGVITAANLSASAASGLSLTGQNEVPQVMTLSSGSGGIAFNDNQPLTVNNITLGAGDLSLSTTSGDLTLTSTVASPGNFTLSAPGTITAATPMSAAATVSAAGDYSITASAMNTAALQPMLTGAASNLSIDFTGPEGTANVSNVALSAPGSVSVIANNSDLTIGSITAGANVTLSSAGTISQGEGGDISAAMLTASAVSGIYLYGSNTVAAVASLTNTTSGEIEFSDNTSVTIGSVNQGGLGAIYLNTNTGDLTLTSPIVGPGSVIVSAGSGAGDNLTVDGITTPYSVELFAGGALTETAGATISVGGEYYATAATMNAAIEQPVFTSSNGDLNLTFTQTGGITDLTGTPLSAPQSVSVTASNQSLTVDSITAGNSVTLVSGGVLAAASGATITLPNTYSATAVSVDLSHPVIVQPTFTSPNGDLELTFTQSGATTDLSSVLLSATGAVSVSISPNASNENLTVGSVSAGSGVTLSTASYSNTSNGALTVTGSINTTAGSVSLATGFACSYCGYTGGPLTVMGSITTTGGGVTASTGDSSTAAFTFDGPISAPGAVNLGTGYYYGGALTTGAISAGGDVNLSTGIYDSGALTAGPINAGGNVNLQAGTASSGVLTVDSITAGADVTLDAGGALAAGTATPVTVTLGGDYAATGATIDPTLFQPAFSEGSFGSLSLTFNGSDGTADLTGHPLTAPASVYVTANNEGLTVDSITAGQDVTLYANGPLVAAETEFPVVITLGGNYSATGTTIDPTLYQPNLAVPFGSLSLTFNDSSGLIDLTGHPLQAPGGSISITANNDSLTVDSLTAGGDITLYAAGNLQQADVDEFAITLGGDYTVTANSIGLSLVQPTFTEGSSGSINLTFTGSDGTADLTNASLTAPGSVSVSAPNENLTVDSITAMGGDITLLAGGALSAAESEFPVVMTTGGNYSATGATIDPVLFNATFTGPSPISNLLSLTFTGSGGEDMTGTAVIAPGSVSISAPNENLTVDSIMAGGDVTLNSGVALANAAETAVSLGGNYSATAQTISAGLLQPTFTEGSFGNLSLTFTQDGAATDISATPLSAPGSVSIFLTGSTENLTVGNITAGGGVTISPVYYDYGSVTAGSVLAGGDVNISTGSNDGGALMVSTINTTGSVTMSTGYYSGGALTTGPITAGGSVSLTAAQGSGGVLTVDTINAGSNVSLFAGGALQTTASSAPVVTLGGSYSATGTTIDPLLYQPQFTEGSEGSLSLQFNQSGGTIDLTGSPLSAPQSVSVQASGANLTVDSITAGGDVSLYAGGALTAASGATIDLFGDYSATGTTIDTHLYQPTFMPGSTGSLSLTFNQTGGVVDLTGFPLTAPGSITLNSSEDLTVDSLTAAGQVSLVAAGALSEGANSVITAQTIGAQANNGITLNGPNAVQSVDSLYNNDMGGISFTNTGDIPIVDSISAAGQTVNLVSLTGAIYNVNYYSYVDAGTLTASAVTGITLVPTYYYYYYNNNITNLGPVSNSTSGGISIINNGDMTLVGDISAPGQAISLTSLNGALNQTAGVITANTLVASAQYGITFNDANAVTTLGALNNQYSGGISFTNGGDLSLGDNLTAIGQTVNVASDAGAVTQQSGSLIIADTLTGSAATGWTLNSANEVTHLGDVSNTGSGGISFTNEAGLDIAGQVSAPGQSVSLVSLTGALMESTGIITAGTVNLSAVTGIDLSDANAADQLGTVTNTMSGDIAFNNSISLTLTGVIDATGQMLSVRSNTGSLSQTGGMIIADTLRASAVAGLSLTGANQVANLSFLANGALGGIAYTSAGGVNLVNDLNGFGQAVSLTALSGAVGQATGELLTAGTLNAAATTGVTLGDANAVTQLGAVNTSSGGVTLNDAVNLSLVGAVQASGQSVSLTGASSVTQLSGDVAASLLTVSAVDGITINSVSGAVGTLTNTTMGGVSVATSSGDLMLTGDIYAPGQNVNLSANGAVDQTGGIITAGVLSASASTGLNLGAANVVNGLGLLTNMTSGGIAIDSVGSIDLSEVIDAPGQSVSLTSTTGAVTQSAGLVIASTLSASAATGITLMDGNLVANLGALSNSGTGGISYLSAGDPFLTGNISAPGQTVTLVSTTGSFTQTAGVITAGALNVSAVTGITLNDANAVASLGSISNTGSGGVSFTNAGDFSVTGQVQAAGQALALVSSGGSINQAGGVINAQDITLSAGGAVNLTDVFASDQVTITASGFSLTAAPTGSTTLGGGSALQTPTLVIESRSGLIDIGDNLNDPGFTGMTITGATLAALNVNSISFYAGYFNPTAPLTDLAPQAQVAIKVGDIAAGFGGFSAPPTGATAYLYAGPASTVSVIGSVTSLNPGVGNIVIGDQTADAWTPGTIAVSGSIGANGTTLAPLNSIELNATNNILLGDSQFQQAILNAEKSGLTEFININGGEPSGVTQTGTGDIFIGSNTLTMRAQGVIVSQNTGATGDDAGIDLVNANAASTVLTLGTTQANPSRGKPVIIDIFGTLNDTTGMAVAGMDLAPSTEIALETPLAVTDFYRANGCVIGEVGVCNLLSVETLPIKLIQGVTLPSSIEGESATASAAAADATKPILYTATTPLIAYTPPAPVGDPTVTGVGSEEIWRGPVCDPNGGAKCL